PAKIPVVYEPDPNAPDPKSGKLRAKRVVETVSVRKGPRFFAGADHGQPGRELAEPLGTDWGGVDTPVLGPMTGSPIGAKTAGGSFVSGLTAAGDLYIPLKDSSFDFEYRAAAGFHPPALAKNGRQLAGEQRFRQGREEELERLVASERLAP